MQLLAGVIKESQLNEAKVDPKYIQAIEDAIAAISIIKRLSLNSDVSVILDNALNVLGGIVDSEGNLIFESQLNEEDNTATEEKVQDTVEKAINSSQSQATLQKMASQLSDEDKQRIIKFMSSVNESIAEGGEPDLEDVTKKLMSLAENNGPQDPQNRSDGKHLLGQVVYGAPVAAMGAGLIKGILVGGAAVGLAAATPFFAAAAAGAVLIGLYKIIKSASSNKPKPTSSGVSGVNVISNPIIRK